MSTTEYSPARPTPSLVASLLVVAALLLGVGLSLAAPSPAHALARLAQCANNLDDDGDAKVDFPVEPGCTSALDATEADPAQPAQCSDAKDQGRDGKTDFPQAPGCTSAADDKEVDRGRPPACADGVDNDADGKTDYPADPGCSWAAESSETDSACSDAIDNDTDAKIDFPSDLGCSDVNDTNESDRPQCDDGRDNDNDGTLDFDTTPGQSADPDCASALDTSEGPSPSPPPASRARCADGIDNDADAKIDFPADRGCTSPADDDESDPQIIVLIPSAQPRLLAPFPIVRMRGRSDRTGVQITLLTIRAPAASTVSIYCSGPSCPRKRLAIRAGRRIVRVRHFERRLRAGSILKIYVTKPGLIGKYTRFRITTHGTPLRVDRCATTPGTKPRNCPTT